MGEVELAALTEIREGLARLLVPEDYNLRGPGRSGLAPFYNRAMTFARDVTVLVLEGLGPRVRSFLDGLSSTGVLGIRVALESGDDREIWLNEWMPEPYALLRRNLDLNGVKAHASQEDLNILMRRETFDHVDVDPFGSPVPFLDSAFQALRRGGFLSMAATDVPVLAGTYPTVCLRRYSSVPARAPFRHEAGLRILVGSVVRWAAKYDMAATPILCFWYQHGYKAFFELSRGAGKASLCLERVGRIRYRRDEGWKVDPEGNVGPLWLGPILDSGLLSRIRVKSYMSSTVAVTLERWREESLAPPLFYTTEDLSRVLRRSPPPLETVLETLRSAGYGAWRTCFSPTGFKTDAPWEELLTLLSPA